MIFDLYDAQTRLSQLVEQAAHGEEIVIAKDGKPLAKLVPLAAGREPRKPGGWEGKVRISEDFDAPLPDEHKPRVIRERDVVPLKESSADAGHPQRRSRCVLPVRMPPLILPDDSIASILCSTTGGGMVGTKIVFGGGCEEALPGP